MADRAVVMASDPGRIAEAIPIEIDRRDPDPERRAASVAAAQAKLQSAFERATGRALHGGTSPAISEAPRPEPLKIVAAGAR
ncbi:hypothetical protein BJ123_1297 [Rhodopseudomonas thermotolerans]|uniref:Uncharacterized protein n=2 Tax=Rhodopseudomonas TaxID=1073 RepID=A0A336JWI7_9BRAD|nr:MULTISPECIES: hypothetical protein [Rhodopseudomonas]RED25824.1 hypothetical protein BJ125_1298 [Rhodopseudomonas pentothenatexigens]REF90958.1 hypothetical protein BJ123_1297 [Rhodopseudomonas thermotolerans]SSW93043.1 hypothetical protein SAMN05892882_1298 [Rhodopseudomonas pentothenatexigens]